ncbi:Glutamyl-tRNA(Gln) amidotransferase subunit A [Penicillium chrysogenum]|uniref:Pc21g23390 protein n=2 Tax=Penicillium chrysogenum species complex TaxID=254878 RepID=B6HIQ1_PENRW|nr:Glutamyl-tRNA(Gln) amidotransferase subunit A [Penicillium chrysogenum]CAP97236.1 Pc21g23390 [Penicillium rubens Wisconsin 54-1255]
MDSPACQAEEMTISKFHQLLRTDPSIGPKLVTKYLEAIMQHNGTLKALITINSAALETAIEKATETLTYNQTNKPFPPLHSVPIILKDNYSTADLPTSAGVQALQNLRTKDDSEVVSQLRAAGAIILAKANLHEFALQGITLSSLGGQTLNPYDKTRTPGGSSGGTGAALAANLGLAGCGTDTMNSLRSPASACGIVGFRPSTGRVSCVGIVPVSQTQDVAGPMGRSVGDVRILYGVMKGLDGGDGDAMEVSKSIPRTGRQVRIGILEAYFQPEIHADGTAEAEYIAENQVVQEIIRSSLDSIQEQDANITFVPIAPSSHADWSYGTLFAKGDTQAFEFKHYLDEFLQSALVSSTQHRSLESIAQSGEFDLQAMTHVFSAALEDPETFSLTSEAYRSRLEFIAALKESVKECFDRYNIDALVYPHQTQLPVKIGAKQQSGRNGVLAALTGRPAICIPAGWSPKTASSVLGVPVGLELMGRRWEDDELLDIAERAERILKGRLAPVLY